MVNWNALPQITKTSNITISKSNDRITLETPDICQYKIYSTSGILVDKNTCYKSHTINRALIPGIYIVSVETSDGIETLKFLN